MAAERDGELRFAVFKVGIRLGSHSKPYVKLMKLAKLTEATEEHESEAARNAFFKVLKAAEGLTYGDIKDETHWHDNMLRKADVMIHRLEGDDET